MKLERELARWAGMETEAVAEGSKTQIVYALCDAKKDIAALASQLAEVQSDLEAFKEAYDDGLQTYAASMLRDALRASDRNRG